MIDLQKIENRLKATASFILIFTVLLAAIKSYGLIKSLAWSYVIILGSFSLLLFVAAALCGVPKIRQAMLKSARVAFYSLGRLGNDTAKFVDNHGNLLEYRGTSFRLMDKNFRIDIICQLIPKFSPSASIYMVETAGDRYLLVFSDKMSTLRETYFSLVENHWQSCVWRTPSQMYDSNKLVKSLRKLYGSVDAGDEVVPDTYFAVVEYEKALPTGQREMVSHDVIFIGACTGQLLEV